MTTRLEIDSDSVIYEGKYPHGQFHCTSHPECSGPVEGCHVDCGGCFLLWAWSHPDNVTRRFIVDDVKIA